RDLRRLLSLGERGGLGGLRLGRFGLLLRLRGSLVLHLQKVLEILDVLLKERDALVGFLEGVFLRRKIVRRSRASRLAALLGVVAARELQLVLRLFLGGRRLLFLRRSDGTGRLARALRSRRRSEGDPQAAPPLVEVGVLRRNDAPRVPRSH